MRIIKNILRAIMLFYKRILFFVARLFTKVNERSMFFESFQGRNYACSPKAIFKEMRDSEKYKEFSFFWAFRNIKDRDIEKATVVKFESFKYYRALAKSKYWVFNSNTRKFVKPGDKHIFIETWHGTPFKKIGCDVENSELDYSKESKKFDYMISPSKYCSEKYISAFGLEGREGIILETGYPRNDKLFDFDENDIANIKKKFGIEPAKKVILYAPTFRDNEHSEIKGYENASGLDFNKLKNELGNEYVILFRAHYFVAKSMDLEKVAGFVYDVSSHEDVNDLYMISDLLITDYSSVFFDFANLKRPIAFYMYDYEKYKQNARDFYIEETNLPGPVIKSQDDLTKEIKKLTSSEFTLDANYENFNKKYNYLDGKNRGLEVAKQIIH